MGILENLGLALTRPVDALIDWDIAAGIGFDIAGKSGSIQDRVHKQQIYLELWHTVKPRLESLLGPSAISRAPLIGVLDRDEWILVNMDGFSHVIRPVIDISEAAVERYLGSASGLSKRVGQLSLTAEVGLIFGYLSRRVLAQFDWLVPRPGLEVDNFLYFVEPNIENVSRRLELPPTDFRTWLMLHEAVHFYQFSAFPWLRGYLNDLLGEFGRIVDEELKAANKRTGGRRLFLSSATRIFGLSERGLRLVKDVQALMAVLEGHGDYVMMEAGRDIPSHSRLELLFKRRERTSGFVEHLLGRLLGMGVKISQYRLGEAFVRQVVERHGWEVFNRVWVGPENLPDLKELEHADEWVARIRP